jgi:hypothetical protein
MGLPISTVNLVLKTASATKAGFGTPLFQTMHMGTLNRVISFQDTTSAGEVFSATHPASLAAKGYKGATPSVTNFKIGRVASTLVLTPDEPSTGKVYSFLISNGLESGLCSFTASGGDDEEDVVDDLLTDIASFTNIASEVTASKVGALDAATLSLVATGDFTITGISGFSEEYTATETYEASLAAIREEDDDFYFFNSDTRDSAVQETLASAIQPTSKEYFTASNAVEAISGIYSVDDTSIGSVLKQKNYSRSTVMFSHDISSFPECAYVGVNAPYSPDERSVVWDGRELVGVSVAKNTLGNKLTSTQISYLDSRAMSYVTETSVGPRILGGKMASGAWIDDIRTQDTIIARVREALDTLILNQAGSKLVGGRAGVALVDAAISKALTPFLASEALESFVTDMTAATIDQSTRTLSNVKFTAVLKGAILRVVVNGTAVNQEV